MLRERKIKHPVLLDPTSAYRASLNVTVYPTATLLDASGHVVWQGQTYYRQAFADACEAQIRALLGEEAPPEDASEADAR